MDGVVVGGGVDAVAVGVDDSVGSVDSAVGVLLEAGSDGGRSSVWAVALGATTSSRAVSPAARPITRPRRTGDGEEVTAMTAFPAVTS